MRLKQESFLLMIFFCFFYSTSNSQQSIDKELLNAYLSKDSSNYLFKKVYLKLSSKADTASYFYFKFFEKDKLNQDDSVTYYSKKLLPLFHQLDTINRLRKVHVRLYYQNLHIGNYDNALKEIQKALDLAKKQKDTAFISLHYADISILYHDFNFFNKGVKYGKKAFELMNNAKNKDYKYLIIANNAIGINFDDWNKPDSAIFYHYKNLKYIKKIKDTLGFAFIYNNIANTHLKIKNYTKAKLFLKKSLAINLIINRDYNLATNYTNLATIALEENNNKIAKNYLKKASHHAKKSNSIEKIRDVLKQEYLYFKKIKEYRTALKKQDEYYILHDSVFNKDRSDKFSKLEVIYQISKKEKEISQQKEQLLAQELAIKSRNIYAILLGSALLILGIIFFSIYKRNQFKRKQLQKEINLKDALASIKTQNRLQEQRLRISRDLHDNIGSQLTFIISSLDNLKYLSKDAGNQLKEKLSGISSFTSDTIFQLRDTIWAMNKTEITIEDLHTRILSYVEKAKKATKNIEFEIHQNIENKISLSSLKGMNVFRVVQEAINNAIKYAQASQISVSISENKNQLQVLIIDNGIGFDLTTTELGNGLSNMEKRMSEIEASILIKSAPKKGTNIRIICNL
jgi:signal transduction histidine kinase